MRVAIVGAGRRGIVHGRAAAGFSDCDVVAIIDPDVERAAALAGELGGRAFTSHLKAFAETQPDAVVLCSPPPLHVDQALAAIDFGATLLIEKPVALDLASVARLGTAARDADRLVLVCQQLRYAAGAIRAKQALEGRRIALVHSWLYRQKPDIRGNWQRSWGGGHVVENQIHPIDLTRYVLGDRGEPTSVYARYGDRFYDVDADWDNWDSYSVSLEFRGGAVGSVATTYGSFPGLPQSSGHDIVADGLVVRFRGNRCELHSPGGAVEVVEATEDPTISMNHAFLLATRTGDTSHLRQDYEDANRSLAICLAANDSAMSGTPITLDWRDAD
jgi:predicted dehydrogenase